MRQAGPLYLPPHPNESASAYDARLRRTTLLNVLEDAIDNACSRLFDELARVEGDVPDELHEWCKNIDLQGSTLHEFCDAAMHHALADGQVHFLVDYPSSVPIIQGQYGNSTRRRRTPGNGLMARRPIESYEQEVEEARFDADGNQISGAPQEVPGQVAQVGGVPQDMGDDALPVMTLAEERALGMRPYLYMIPHTHLLAINTAKVGGEMIVTHLRILEEDVVRDGFAEKPVRRVRILEPGYWEVWTQDDTAAGWSMTSSGELRKNANELWDRVPVFTFAAGKRKSMFDVKPPFLDLAYKNVEHWQSSSDQRNILAQARFPMLAVSGFEGDIQTPYGDEDEDGPIPPGPLPFVIGPNTVLTTGDPSGKWYYVEPTGQSIEHGAKDLDRLEREMRMMGLEPLTPDANRANTAMEAGIDEAKARSPLEEWARRLEARMAMAIRTMLEWQGIPGDPRVKLKAKVTMGPQGSMDFSMLSQMRLTGNLSKLTLLEEAKRRGLLSEQFDPLEEVARLLIEGPMGDMAPYLGLPPTAPEMMNAPMV